MAVLAEKIKKSLEQNELQTTKNCEKPLEKPKAEGAASISQERHTLPLLPSWVLQQGWRLLQILTRTTI